MDWLNWAVGLVDSDNMLRSIIITAIINIIIIIIIIIYTFIITITIFIIISISIFQLFSFLFTSNFTAQPVQRSRSLQHSDHLTDY